MAQYLIDFVNYFGISGFYDSTLTVQQALGMSIIAFIGCIITIAGIRCIFELIKTLTDWSKFR